MKLLVLGGTGYIGSHLVPKLLARGHQVCVATRSVEKLGSHEWVGQVEARQADLTSPPTLEGLCRDVEAAFYLVHSMGSGDDFAELDREAARNFVAVARDLEHVVYLGGLLPADESRASAHLHSRAEVGQLLRSSLATSEFRAGPVIGAGSIPYEIVRHLTERLPAMVAPRWICNPVQPIALDDMLEYLVLAVERQRPGIYEVGADPVSFRQMLLGYARARGLRRLIVPVPVLAPRLAARWIGWVTPVSKHFALPLVEGIVEPLLAESAAAREVFPEVEPIPYAEAVRRALAGA